MKIAVKLDGKRDYFVTIDEGLDLAFKGKVCIVTNETVAPLYLDAVKKQIKADKLICVVLPDGEQFKTWESVMKITDAMFEAKFDRKSTLVSLGGGVVSDLTGFAASIYERGVEFVALPTTLLAAVDASVGGKTGFNNKFGKNLLGSFWQPRGVFCQTEFLKSLPAREFSAGVAEAIKMAVIFEPEFLGAFESDEAKFDTKSVIANCVSIKSAVVAADEKESNVRAMLNYGHTFAHAIELTAGYGQILHGEAVAVGMVLANEVSRRLGLLSGEFCERVRDLLVRFGLPVSFEVADVERFYDSMLLDKKNENGEVKFVLATQDVSQKISLDSGVLNVYGVKRGVEKSLVLDVLRSENGKLKTEN